MLYTLKPFAADKNQFGQVYNAHCAIIPFPEDWILLLDYDAMILAPQAYGIIQKAIDAHPEVEIFTAYASRIGYSDQRLDPSTIDDNDSILHHLKLAQQQAEQWPNGECNHILTAAGFFLLFRKSYWIENKFQPTLMDQDGHFFDWNFCKSAMKRGTVRLIRGVYCWHTYRLGKENIRDGSHLR